MEMLKLDSISKSFFQKLALDDVSLSIEEGEIFGLLGPNGAGKTTLIRVINRIIEQDKGSIRFKGELMNDKHLVGVVEDVVKLRCKNMFWAQV